MTGRVALDPRAPEHSEDVATFQQDKVKRQLWDLASGEPDNKKPPLPCDRTQRGFRVTAANRLFAAHKAGWLTDKGLLYVVLGPPPGVRRFANGEERWYYPDGGLTGGPITYTFRPRPSTFAPDYYELVRRPEYELLWYAAVEKWRTPPTALTGPNVPSDLPAR